MSINSIYYLFCLHSDYISVTYIPNFHLLVEETMSTCSKKKLTNRATVIFLLPADINHTVDLSARDSALYWFVAGLIMLPNTVNY